MTFDKLVSRVIVKIEQENCVIDLETVAEFVDGELVNTRPSEICRELDIDEDGDDEEILRDISELVFGMVIAARARVGGIS